MEYITKYVYEPDVFERKIFTFLASLDRGAVDLSSVYLFVLALAYFRGLWSEVPAMISDDRIAVVLGPACAGRVVICNVAALGSAATIGGWNVVEVRMCLWVTGQRSAWVAFWSDDRYEGAHVHMKVWYLPFLCVALLRSWVVANELKWAQSKEAGIKFPT